MTKKKAIKIMMQLKAEYYYAFKDIPDDLLKLKIENFIKAMDGYTDQEIDIALGKVLVENKTLPTIAHFVEAIENYKESLLPTAEEEWASVVRTLNGITKIFEIYQYLHTQNEVDDIKTKARELYQTEISKYVKSYYATYQNFLDIKKEKLDFERARFLKNFPEYRRQLLKNKNSDKNFECNSSVSRES